MKPKAIAHDDWGRVLESCQIVRFPDPPSDLKDKIYSAMKEAAKIPRSSMYMNRIYVTNEALEDIRNWDDNVRIDSLREDILKRHCDEGTES